jgi:hypothetical protein
MSVERRSLRCLEEQLNLFFPGEESCPREKELKLLQGTTSNFFFRGKNHVPKQKELMLPWRAI